KKLASDERGVTAVEYAVVAAGVVAVVSVVFAQGGIVDETITGVFESMQTAIDSIITGA
ncbi:TPA: Flp family type IVb pilin, partial [Aeromonas dhakensis]|nr:Flp family type IVb pilin [Aeromonas dhakensis]